MQNQFSVKIVYIIAETDSQFQKMSHKRDSEEKDSKAKRVSLSPLDRAKMFDIAEKSSIRFEVSLNSSTNVKFAQLYPPVLFLDRVKESDVLHFNLRRTSRIEVDEDFQLEECTYTEALDVASVIAANLPPAKENAPGYETTACGGRLHLIYNRAPGCKKQFEVSMEIQPTDAATKEILSQFKSEQWSFYRRPKFPANPPITTHLQLLEAYEEMMTKPLPPLIRKKS